jgi:hypothetical protein
MIGTPRPYCPSSALFVPETLSSPLFQTHFNFFFLFHTNYSFVTFSGVLPPLRWRVEIVAAQLWTYEQYEPHPSWLSSLLDFIETAPSNI